MENLNFDFSLLNSVKVSSINDHISYFNKSVEQCQLCNKLRRTFYCRTCVKNGDFVHSTSHFSERFAEKRLALLKMQNEKNQFILRLQQKSKILEAKENKMEDIRMHSEKIAVLQFLISETRRRIKKKKQILGELITFNHRSKKTMKKNDECKLDLKVKISEIFEQQPLIFDKLSVIKPRLKELIRTRIKELVQYIFPINEIQSSKSSSKSSDSQEDIKNKLAEATRTAYIQGRWITNNCGETQHAIVAPTLPDSGDYSSYIDWISVMPDNSLPNTDNLHKKPISNLSAALTYTTQLLNIIAYYLDIRLPNKLNYHEFCLGNLDEHNFNKCVTNLNANILMLCLSQNVDSNLLQPSQTVRNLLLLLDTSHSDLGRQEVIDLDESSVSYFEEQLNHYLKTITAKSNSNVKDDRKNIKLDNVSNYNNDDDYHSDHLSTDWEAIPLVSFPEAAPNLLSRRSTITSNQTNSLAGGLVSAAASFASIWRGWSISKQN